MKSRIKRMSYHTHTDISDGKLSPEELIKKAILLGFEVLAITDHSSRPSDILSDGWGIDFYSDKDYSKLIELKEKYKDKIKILVGAEFDWIPERQERILEEIKKRNYDLKILSFHLVVVDGEHVSFNSSEENFRRVLGFYNGDVKKMVINYYKNLRDGIRTGWFDVVGHLDLIKSFNDSSRYFSEEDDWYREEISKTLGLVKKFNLKLDLNLRGFRLPIGEQFPSRWIIDAAKKMQIELLIGTDAHSADDLQYDVERVEGLLNG